MTSEPTLSQRLRRALFHNLGLKLFSLLVSLGLFTVVHGAEVGQRSLFVPVVALLPSEPSNKVLVGELPDKVKVTLSGSRSVINSIGAVDAVQIDLRDAKRSYRFEPDSFGFPAGIEVEVTPPALTLEWEDRMERRLPVRPQLTGLPDPALELAGKPTVTPAQIVVRGPRSRVEALREVLTEPIPLGAMGVGVQRRRVALQALPNHVTTAGTTEVWVELVLEPRNDKRRLRRLPVAALGVSQPVLIRPEHVDVMVSGPERTLEELDPEHVVPVIELGETSLGRGVVSAPVKLRGIDNSLHVLRIEPSEVLVRLK